MKSGTPKEIFSEMKEVYDGKAPSYVVFKNWHRQANVVGHQWELLLFKDYHVLSTMQTRFFK